MNLRKKNAWFVSIFLLGMFGFTGLMTFYVGPIMMAKRNEVAQDQVLFKCREVLDSTHIQVQLRAWERPNTYPEFPVQFAGLNAPPPGKAEDQAVIAWAEAQGIPAAVAAKMGEASYKTLVAFIRRQNLFIYQADGRHSTEGLAPDSRVHVLVSGTNVNLKQIQSGLALHDTREPHAFSDQYAAAEAEARAAKKGLWQYLPAQP